MVRKTKEVRKLLLSLRGCYKAHEIREFVKSKMPDVKHSTIYYMLRVLKEEGKVVVYGQKRRTMYCINASRGSKTQRDVDECLDKFLPSFNLVDLARCVYGDILTTHAEQFYLDLIWELIRRLNSRYKYLIFVKGKRLRVITK